MMDQRSRRQHWEDAYRGRDASELSWFEPVPKRALALIQRMGLSPDDAIIDIGGGLSSLSDALAAEGHTDVTVLDISAEAIQRGAERRGSPSGVKTIVADITTWRPERRYRVWHDRAVLHFLVDPADRDAYRRALLTALSRGGDVAIATFAPSGPDRCSGLPVQRYGRDTLHAFLGEVFELRDSAEFDHVTPAGRVQRFHMGWFRRRR
jgi:hypothetical protein